MRRHKQLTPEEKKQWDVEYTKRKKFKKLAKEREARAKLKDSLFIKDYVKLCCKHKRLLGSLSPEACITHLKYSKDIKRALSNVNFHPYNRHEDHYPDVGSGWYLGNWRKD
jgi:hypothetical protein